jgi:hypothetical protein
VPFRSIHRCHGTLALLSRSISGPFRSIDPSRHGPHAVRVWRDWGCGGDSGPCARGATAGRRTLCQRRAWLDRGLVERESAHRDMDTWHGDRVASYAEPDIDRCKRIATASSSSSARRSSHPAPEFHLDSIRSRLVAPRPARLTAPSIHTPLPSWACLCRPYGDDYSRTRSSKSVSSDWITPARPPYSSNCQHRRRRTMPLTLDHGREQSGTTYSYCAGLPVHSMLHAPSHMGEVVETQPTIGSNVEEVVHKNVHFRPYRMRAHASNERDDLHQHVVCAAIPTVRRAMPSSSFL